MRRGVLQGQFERLLDLPAASLRDGVGGAVVEQRLMILDAGDVPAMHQTTAVQAKEVFAGSSFPGLPSASHRELSVRMLMTQRGPSDSIAYSSLGCRT